MQELEKILKEIDEIKVGFDTECRSECDLYDWACGACVGECDEYIKARAKEIIRKHMDAGWIPVEERLPEEPKENPEFEGKKIELYLVTVKGTKYPFRAFWNGKQFTDGWSVLDVIAWRPLPEPYRTERSEGE